MNNYDTDYLLDRAYSSFKLDKGKIKLTRIMFEKRDKKTYIDNFQEVCASMNCDQNELKKYISREIQMDTSIKENGSLKIDGMVRSKESIETIIKDYIINNIMCKACKSCKTRRIKEGRVMYLECLTCRSKQTLEKN